MNPFDPPSTSTPTSCPSEVVEDIVKKHIAELSNEIMVTKSKIEKMSQARNTESSCKAKTDYKMKPNPRVNYASEAVGAQIASVNDDPFHKINGLAYVVSWIAPGMFWHSNGPRQLITESMLPGNCYAYKGNISKVVIKLPHKV